MSEEITTPPTLEDKLAAFKAITQKYAITPQVLGELLEDVVAVLRQENSSGLTGVLVDKIGWSRTVSTFAITYKKTNDEGQKEEVQCSIPFATPVMPGIITAADKVKIDALVTANLLSAVEKQKVSDLNVDTLMVKGSVGNPIADVNGCPEGYSHTSPDTQHLPSVCTTNKDKWGTIITIWESGANGTGFQLYVPIDGTYKGNLFVRWISNSRNAYASYGDWQKVAMANDLPRIASTSTPGLVTTSTAYGIQLGDVTGTLRIWAATKDDITKGTNFYNPICSNQISFAVKHWLVNNKEQLTSDEQAKAKQWLGIVESAPEYICNIQGFADIANPNKADVYAVYSDLKHYGIKLSCVIKSLTFYGRPAGYTGRRYCRIYRVENDGLTLWMKSKNYIDFESKATLGEAQGTFEMEIYEGDAYISPDETILIGFVEAESSQVFCRTGFAVDMNISGGVATESIVIPASVQAFSPAMKIEYEVNTQSIVDKINALL